MISQAYLRLRLATYESAIAMAKGKTQWDPTFRWPWYPGSIPQDPRNPVFWQGCVNELRYLLKHCDAEDDTSSLTPAKFPLTPKSRRIKIPGFIGSWDVVSTVRGSEGETLFFLEHTRFGRATTGLLVDKSGHVIDRNVVWEQE